MKKELPAGDRMKLEMKVGMKVGMEVGMSLDFKPSGDGNFH